MFDLVLTLPLIHSRSALSVRLSISFNIGVPKGLIESQGKEIQPKQKKKGDNGLAVLPQALPERPAATLDRPIVGKAWNKRTGFLAPLLPILPECSMKLFILSTDGMRIKCEQDRYQQGEAPPQAGGKGKSKSQYDVSGVERVPDIGIRSIGGKELVLFDMPGCPQSHCNAQNNQGYASEEQPLPGRPCCTDQNDKGDANKLAEAFPMVPNVVKESLESESYCH